MPTLSIIIVNYKTPELIAACVASIYEWTKNTSFEIIIVNNASKANDEEFLKDKFPEIKWIETGYNAGFGRANNLGMKAATSEYFLLLNSDTLIIDESIEIALTRYRLSNDIAVAGAKQLAPNLTEKVSSYSFASIKRYSWIVFPHKKVDDFLLKVFPEPSFDDPEEVDYVVGAFMVLSRGIFEKTNGFDEDFFMYGEDAEWGFRLQKFGKAVIFQDCKFIHDEWGSTGGDKEKRLAAITYFNRFDAQSQLSNLAFIRKSYGVLPFVLLMLHYWLWIPLFYSIKVITEVKNGLKLPITFTAQKNFAGTVLTFTRFFGSLLFNKSTFYKIKK
ncbi:MAG: glycosyltransferase family 2 protein [Spirosomaceae bacterium]|nr:glycosyltransferase family 2 protein [Spirosomataceae bacterium]